LIEEIGLGRAGLSSASAFSQEFGSRLSCRRTNDAQFILIIPREVSYQMSEMNMYKGFHKASYGDVLDTLGLYISKLVLSIEANVRSVRF